MEALLPVPGTWSLRRWVLDRRTGHRGDVHGSMQITAGPGAAGGQRWSESGVLRWQGQERAVSRVLLLRPVAPQGQWWVHFADGRPFHPWRPGEEVEHPCAADVYRGRIDVGPCRVGVRWDVTGPHKDQLLVTRLDLALSSAAS